jgi:uncharacterized membrane protein YGL010W
MRTFNQWMDEYAVSHQHPTNQVIHKICVPLIMFSVIGLIWMIPTPAWTMSVPYLNWSSIFVTLCLFFYLTLNWKMFLGMLVQTMVMLLACAYLAQRQLLLVVSVVVFILAWIAQFYGHKLEGKKPSFLKDLVFLLIGPLWVTRFFYARIGIKV